MSLIGILVVLLVIGVIVYIIRQVPMDATIRNIAYAILLLFVVLWLLQTFGLLPAGFSGMRLK